MLSRITIGKPSNRNHGSVAPRSLSGCSRQALARGPPPLMNQRKPGGSANRRHPWNSWRLAGNPHSLNSLRTGLQQRQPTGVPFRQRQQHDMQFRQVERLLEPLDQGGMAPKQIGKCCSGQQQRLHFLCGTKMFAGLFAEQPRPAVKAAGPGRSSVRSPWPMGSGPRLRKRRAAGTASPRHTSGRIRVCPMR